MNSVELISIVTFGVTILIGIIAKKVKFISNNLILIQNILIGIIVSLIEFLITKDFSYSIAVSGLVAGGIYDIVHNLDKIIYKGGKQMNKPCRILESKECEMTQGYCSGHVVYDLVKKNYTLGNIVAH